jgi:chorismate-pyruvate lyase
MGATPTPPGPLWPSPRPLWQASYADVANAQSGRDLTGPWRLLLLGDGSPTRHLQSLTGLPVEVEVIAMTADANPGTEAPAEVTELKAPLLRRQVWLRCGEQTLAWAESWWNQGAAAEHLQQRNQPIWKSLMAERAELYREVDGLALVEAPWLAAGLGSTGPFWSRHYRFFHQGRELTVIREVFSPALEHWLGPAESRGPSHTNRHDDLQRL